MIDIDTIKANYANMLDTQLINIAKEDGPELPPEAFAILKEEFKKRNLDLRHIEAATEQKLELLEEKVKKIKDSTDKDFAKMMWDYIVDEKGNGTTDEDIITGLQERGLDEENSRRMLLNFKPKLKAIIDAADKKMLIGGFAFIAGIAVTLLSYTTALNGGGYYIVTWGAILFGAINFFVGMSDKDKYKKILEAVESAAINKKQL